MIKDGGSPAPKKIAEVIDRLDKLINGTLSGKIGVLEGRLFTVMEHKVTDGKPEQPANPKTDHVVTTLLDLEQSLYGLSDQLSDVLNRLQT